MSLWCLVLVSVTIAVMYPRLILLMKDAIMLLVVSSKWKNKPFHLQNGENFKGPTLNAIFFVMNYLSLQHVKRPSSSNKSSILWQPPLFSPLFPKLYAVTQLVAGTFNGKILYVIRIKALLPVQSNRTCYLLPKKIQQNSDNC